MSRGVLEEKLQELREVREILGGAQLDRIEALVEGLSPGSVNDKDFEAVETALWDGSHLAARDTLVRRLDADRSNKEAAPECGCGAKPARKGRKKTIATRFGKIAIERQYYHCAKRGSGVAPRDLALGVAGESFSPRLLRVVARFNAEASARRASDPVFESMRLSVDPSQVGRKARKVGEKVQEWEQSEPLDPGASVCGVAIGGTGIPVRKQEVADHAGKQEDGSAKTREVKVAAFFSLGPPDKKTGNAQRDPDSVSVATAIESAAGGEPSPFAQRLSRETECRGYGRTDPHFALGDGRDWICNTVDDIFPGAVQILDLYHVLEWLSDVAKATHGRGEMAKALAKHWRGMVRSGRLQPVVEELESHATRHEKAGETDACFESNRSKMDFPRYRAAGFPVGSGVIEGACRSVVCERLKKSGMFWSVAGANKILVLRRAVGSNTFDDFREDWEEKKKAA